MKKHLVLLLLVVSLFSCSKNDEETSHGNFTVNNKAYTTNYAVASFKTINIPEIFLSEVKPISFSGSVNDFTGTVVYLQFSNPLYQSKRFTFGDYSVKNGIAVTPYECNVLVYTNAKTGSVITGIYGTVQISESGDTYIIKYDVETMTGEHVKGTYKGDIEGLY